MNDLPLPPMEYRQFTGLTDPKLFDNPDGRLLFDDVAASSYDTVLDFGCGCGRLARRLIQQNPRPRRYVGIDLHRRLIDWCRDNLSPRAADFQFDHHDAYHQQLNPEGTRASVPFPIRDREVTLLIGWSVFTHLLEADAAFYIREMARVLSQDGVAVTTWFVFDKADFPMMQDFQNALLINSSDPTNAVIFDKGWLSARLAEAGLVATRILAPRIRGFQWRVYLQHQAPDRTPARWPADEAPHGLARPPLRPSPA